MITSCPTASDLAAAISNGPSDSVRQHLAICARCADEWDAVERVVASYRKLPWQDAPAARIEEQRTALLASAALAKPVSPRRWGRWAVPVLAAAAVVVLVAAWPVPATSPSAPFHGTLTAHGEAAFLRISSRPDEVVMLTAGTLSVDVTPLARGERFRIVTKDAEVEVRGTAFEVIADRGRLVAVHVWHGKVEVRPLAGDTVVLTRGESWATPPITTSAVPIQVSTTSRTEVVPEDAASRPRQRKAAGPVPGASRPSAPEQIADIGTTVYQEAWTALRAGDHEGAARGFERAATIAPHSALTEDAWYWRAVSLARAGQPTRARAAFGAFLENYRDSPRAPQASAMLGWLLFDAGDLAGAEDRFRTAVADPAPAVRDSAAQGLEAIRRRRE